MTRSRKPADAARPPARNSPLCLEQLAGLVHARRGVAVFAGGDAAQRGQVPPAEGGRVVANSSVTVR